METPASRRGRGYRSLAAAGLLALVVIVLGTSTPTEAADGGRNPREGKVSLLYVVDAGEGALKPGKGTGAPFVLSLRSVSRNAVWFSDRPARRSGSFPSRGLAEGWRAFGFAADPPNSALTFEDRRGIDHTFILELSHPRYRSKARSLVFDARPVEGAKAGNNLREHARVAERPSPRRFGSASLFVDDAEATNLDGCVFTPYQECVGVNDFGADLPGIEAQGSTWWTFSLTKANLEGANLEGINIYESGIESSDLAGVNLKGATLPSLDLLGTNLDGANLAGANLEDGILEETFFEEANLSNTNLIGASLNGADLIEANLRGAELGSGTDFERVTFYNTIMPDGSLCSSFEAQGCSTSK
jgi:uncharacterized protein YjbI with pentapeptide repeats